METIEQKYNSPKTYETFDERFESAGSFLGIHLRAKDNPKRIANEKADAERKAKKEKAKAEKKANKAKLKYDRKAAKEKAKATGGANWRKVWRKERKKYGGSFAKRALKTATVGVTMAVPRNAASFLIRNNFLHVGNKLFSEMNKDSKKWKEAVKFWEKIGGNQEDFKYFTKLGGAKKGFLKADGSDDNYENLAGGDDAAIAAYIAAGSSIVAALINKIGKPSQTTQAEVDDLKTKGEDSLEKLEGQNGLSGEDVDTLLAEMDGSTIIDGVDDVYFWSGVAILGVTAIATTIYFVTKKK